jgi:hypothetical protein
LILRTDGSDRGLFSKTTVFENKIRAVRMIPSVENSKRISILNQSEINELYEIPIFNDDERRWYFELHNSEQELLKIPGSMKTKVDAILQLGYFKAKNQFFKYQYDEVKSDIDYILNQYFDKKKLAKPIISRETKRLNQRRILSLLGFTYFTKSKHDGPLLAKARELRVTPTLVLRTANWLRMEMININLPSKPAKMRDLHGLNISCNHQLGSLLKNCNGL